MAASSLDPGCLEALRNLHQKQQGEDVGFINIADARTLTDLGLALRTPQGWQITDAGVRFLATAS